MRHISERFENPVHHPVLEQPAKTFEKCTKTIVLNKGNLYQKRQEIRDYFHNSFSLYEDLFNCIEEEGYYQKANNLRHPLIFYYAHTAVFFINKLNVSKFINRRVNEHIESICSIGVDEMSWDDLDEKNYDWPSIEEVRAYRNECRNIVDEFITNCDVALPIDWNHPLWIVMMGIEHERIHLETSSVLIRELPLSLVKEHSFWGNICTESGNAPQNTLLPVKGKQVAMGKDKNTALYGWDNEYGHFEEMLSDFSASKYLVSNEEFKAFVEDGGYQKTEFWTEEGQNWLNYTKATMPYFWRSVGSSLHLRTMLQEIPLPMNWPAEVNYLEAKAFCNWLAKKTSRSIRLPKESEWYCLRGKLDTDQPYWQKAPGNLNLEHAMSSCPVDSFEQADGFFDIIGNVWQWTETPIDGFEGFEVHPAYDDFSTPTFDGKHNVFKGGCWISTGNYAIKDSRYAFRRHFFQHAGFRYVEANPIKEITVGYYNKSSLVSMYTQFHFGKECYFNTPNFPKNCVDIATSIIGKDTFTKVLDLGCAVGRSSFELAKYAEHVDAIDFSARLIEIPSKLQSEGRVKYSIPIEGDIAEFKEVNIEAFEGFDTSKSRIVFAQGDACNLKSIYSGYDLVFASNLLDRLYNPQKFIEDVQSRITKNGYLVLVSPYTWLEEYTPKANWIGGFKSPTTGENQTTLNALTEMLSDKFSQVETAIDIPFVIRETKRKYQHSIAEMTIWQKHG